MFGVLVLCVPVAVTGCGTDEAVPTQGGGSSTLQAQEAEATSPVSSVVEPEPSPEERAAQEVFRSMTADGVRPEEVEAATQRLQELGPAALPVLASGLKSERAIQREMAATMLALFGAEASEVADALIDALEDESDFVRANAATALAQMEGQAEHVVPVFGEFLDSEDSNLRTMAVMNLGVLDPSAAKPLVGRLVATLNSDDPSILLPVVELLGRIGPDAKAAIVKLKSLDTSDNAELETAVTVAMIQIEAEAE